MNPEANPQSPIPWLGVTVTVIIVLAGIVANYAVMVYRQGAVEKRMVEHVAELRDAIRALASKLEPAAGHAFSIDALTKAIETLEWETRRAREWIHKLRTSSSNVIFLLHLIRRGVQVPASAIDKIAADITAAEDPNNGGGEDPHK